MKLLIFSLLLFMALASQAQSPQKPTTQREAIKAAGSPDSAVSDARKLSADMNEFVKSLIATIDLIDTTYPKKVGEGFLNGFKEISADGGKSYILINEHVVNISASRNGVTRALDDYAALIGQPSAQDRAKFAIEFMSNIDLCFLTLEKPATVIFQAQRGAKQDDSADEMEEQFHNLKTRSLSMRLKMYSLVRDFLDKNK